MLAEALTLGDHPDYHWVPLTQIAPEAALAVVAAALVRMAERGPRSVVARARSGDRLTVEALGDPLRDRVRLVGPARIIATVEPSPELLHELGSPKSKV